MGESRLLGLPRELRDDIIDWVLISGIPAPTKQPTNRPIAKRKFGGTFYPQVFGVSPPQIQRSATSLYYVNKQLHVETSQRAAVLSNPLVLDILSLDDGSVHCTWLNVPLKKNWEKISMEVNVRMQRVDVRKLRHRGITEGEWGYAIPWECTMEAEWEKDTGTQQVVAWFVQRTVSQTIRKALLGVLDPILDPINGVNSYGSEAAQRTIAQLHINVDAACMDSSAEQSAGLEAWYRPDRHVESFTRELGEHIYEDVLCRFSMGEPSRPPVRQRPWLLEIEDMFSYVGQMELQCQGNLRRAFRLDEMVQEGSDFLPWAEKECKAPIRERRRELQWE